MLLLSGVRPFGVSLLVAGWDSDHGPSLYQVDPSGSFWAWKASAIGKNMVNAKTFLEKRYAFVLFRIPKLRLTMLFSPYSYFSCASNVVCECER